MRCLRGVFLLIVPGVLACGAPAAQDEEPEVAAALLPAELEDAAWATAWTDLACAEVARGKLSPPVAARVYAYLGLALYEGTAGVRRPSLAGRVRGYDAPATPRGRIDEPLAMTEAARQVLAALLGDGAARAIGDLATTQQQARRAQVSRRVQQRSLAYGQAVAAAVLARAAADGFAQRGEHAYTPDDAPHAWKPTSGGSGSPLEPGWGTLAPFFLRSADECAPPAPVAFSMEPGSPFYEEARAVYVADGNAQAEHDHIARYWADLPGESATPAGHWLALAGQLLREREADLATTTATLAATTLAMGDAFISCWHAKYATNLLRPETYIRAYIDAAWTPRLRTPSFPEYTSGHSVASAAAADMLAASLGGGPVTDRTAPGFAPRTFSSLRAAADEAAVSRLYGGIHYPMGITAGLAQGRCIAERAQERLALPR